MNLVKNEQILFLNFPIQIIPKKLEVLSNGKSNFSRNRIFKILFMLKFCTSWKMSKNYFWISGKEKLGKIKHSFPLGKIQFFEKRNHPNSLMLKISASWKISKNDFEFSDKEKLGKIKLSFPLWKIQFLEKQNFSVLLILTLLV